jgi:hypothetical protein
LIFPMLLLFLTGVEPKWAGLPKKKPVTMRLDSDVIAWLKADGRGYQTKANWLLRQAMTHFTEKMGATSRARRAGRIAKVK